MAAAALSQDGNMGCSDAAMDFRDFYHKHAPRLVRVLRAFVAGTPLEAEDIEQEVWIRVFKGLPGFRGESKTATWLTAVAFNTCRSGLNRGGREWGCPGGNDKGYAAQPDVLRLMDLQRAVDRLPPGYRSVLLLHVRGYTHAEIGMHLGISIGTSKSQLAKARKRLRHTASSTPLTTSAVQLAKVRGT